MLVTVLQVVVVPIALAAIAAFGGFLRGPKSRRRASIEKDVAILKELPADAAVREDVLALIRYEVQKLQQLEGYVTESQVELPEETTKLLEAREAAKAARKRAGFTTTGLVIIALGLALMLGAVIETFQTDYNGGAGWLSGFGLTLCCIGTVVGTRNTE